MKFLSDNGRIAAICLFVFAFLLAWGGSRIEYAFSSDPLGPRAFPLLLALALAVFSVWLFLRPGEHEAWPSGAVLWKALGIPVTVAIASLLMSPIGFFAAMALMVAVIAWIFGASPRQSLLNGIIQGGLWQLVFVHLLEVYLPTGTIWEGLFK